MAGSMVSWFRPLRVSALAAIVVALAQIPTSADEKPVKPQFNGAYFGKMPRAWVEILKIDPDRRIADG